MTKRGRIVTNSIITVLMIAFGIIGISTIQEAMLPSSITRVEIIMSWAYMVLIVGVVILSLIAVWLKKWMDKDA
jgi:TRAP-type C4-dicarboxylate transport system permease small subunit